MPPPGVSAAQLRRVEKEFSPADRSLPVGERKRRAQMNAKAAAQALTKLMKSKGISNSRAKELLIKIANQRNRAREEHFGSRVAQRTKSFPLRSFLKP